MSFEQRADQYRERVESVLERAIPPSDRAPERLHRAMRYATLDGGKRIRPLLAYAAGETLALAPEAMDAPAAAVELIHAFSLVHDDLPAMDDDDLRRGKPTVHRQFDEATAILAADALQPLAFEVLANAPGLTPPVQVALVQLFAQACGSLGMTGGQAIDLESEGAAPDREALERMHRMKTGALIRAAVTSAGCVATGLPAAGRTALERYATNLGLAFQIKDDLLDIEGETGAIGKRAGADAARGKATWPALFGTAAARERCDALYAEGLGALDHFGERAEPLRWLARLIVERRY